MSLRARFVANWVYPECEWPESNEDMPTMALHFQLSNMWRPPLIHINSVDDKEIFENDGGVIQITGNVLDPSNSIVQAFRVADTYLTSSCSSFSFKNFPFDQLTCDTIIDVDISHDILKIQEAIMDIDRSESNIIDSAEVWDFVRVNSTITEVPYIYGFRELKNRIYFTITLKRKCQYYITNILLPIWLPSILQISILILPPEHTERPNLSVTVVLAYAVSLTFVLEQIPQTTETVYLIVLIDLHIIVSVFMTIYLFVVSNLTLARKKIKNKLRHFDLIFGISTFVLVVFKDFLLILFMIYDI